MPCSGRLSVEIAIAPGWHINAHSPLQDYLIPTTLAAVAGSGWRLGEPSYPEPEVRRLGFQREPLALYQGRLRIKATYELENPSGLAQCDRPVTLSLRLQACNDAICLAPEDRVLRERSR